MKWIRKEIYCTRPYEVLEAAAMGSYRGYLTVYLSLILSIMTSLCLVLIMGAGENLQRMEIECVTDVCMNNILAEYHRELLEQYDLFFIDTSYGTAKPTYENTAEHLKEYLTYNLSGEDIFLSDFYHKIAPLSVASVEITEASSACDEGGAVLRRQIVDVMYQRIGVTYLQQVADWVKVVKDNGLDTRDVLAEQKAAVQKLEEWNGTVAVVDGKERELVVESPGKNVVSFWEAGMLNLMVEDTQTLSSAKVLPRIYVSHRKCLQGTGMRSDIVFNDNFGEQLLFHEYILSYTGRYDKAKDNGLLKYQTEYILSGKSTDVENLKNVVYQLLAVRAAANALYLTTDTIKMGLVEGVSLALATAVLLPELQPLFQTVIVLTWALVESIYDVAQLLQGHKVPLMKTALDWHYSLENMLLFGGSLVLQKRDTGLSYEDYLRILLCLQEKATTTYRLMDIMEMDIRQTPGNQYFCMDACIDSLRADIVFTNEMFLGRGGISKKQEQYTISRSYGY